MVKGSLSISSRASGFDRFLLYKSFPPLANSSSFPPRPLPIFDTTPLLEQCHSSLVKVIFLLLSSIFQHPSIDMHTMSPPQSSDMVRRDSGNSIEDYKILQSAAAFAQFTPSSKVCLLFFFHPLRAAFRTSPFLSTLSLVLGARIQGLSYLRHILRTSARIHPLQDSDPRPLWSCFTSSSLGVSCLCLLSLLFGIVFFIHLRWLHTSCYFDTSLPQLSPWLDTHPFPFASCSILFNFHILQPTSHLTSTCSVLTFLRLIYSSSCPFLTHIMPFLSHISLISWLIVLRIISDSMFSIAVQ